jgi:hypothetical protein
MPTYTSPFTGTVVQPTDVSFYNLTTALFTADVDLYWPAVVNPTQVPAARIIDASANSAGLTIVLPQADQGAVGTDILIRNKGSYTFTVTDFVGGQSVSIAVGVSKYFYLTNNTTQAGTWSNVTFGTGTSAADAASLQGAGLTTIDGLLATTQNIIQVSSAPTLTDASRAATYVWTGGTGTINLPNYSTLSDGWYVGFRNGGTGTLNFTPVSPSTLNAQNTITTNPGDSGFIVYQASSRNFFTIGLAAPSNVTFTSATYDVDSIIGSSFSLVTYAPIIQSYVALSGTRTTNLTVTLPATTQIYILSNITGSSSYVIQFTISGGANTITLANNQVATVLSDGTTLYVLTQATTGSFYADNGTATNPSFSFTTDTTTGMYLVGTSVLAMTANGTKILQMDNSSLGSPQISTPATFNAGLISGGTF